MLHSIPGRGNMYTSIKLKVKHWAYGNKFRSMKKMVVQRGGHLMEVVSLGGFTLHTIRYTISTVIPTLHTITKHLLLSPLDNVPGTDFLWAKIFRLASEPGFSKINVIRPDSARINSISLKKLLCLLINVILQLKLSQKNNIACADILRYNNF